MLLIDGVRYELWTPQKEVEEFHPLVKEHYKEIFGVNAIPVEGTGLKSEAGRSSVPDWFVITFGNPPQLHIVEIELSFHQLYDHIVNQVGRFINGIKNTVTQKKVVEAMYQEISRNKQRKVELDEAIGSGEIYKFLADLVAKAPILTIIIENKTQELEEAISLLKYSPIRIVEFQTFKRVGAEAVHAHLFEPVSTLVTVPLRSTSLPSENSFEKELSSKDIEYGGIYFRQEYWDLFPNMHTKIEMQDTRGDIIQRNYDPKYHGLTLRKWFTEYQVKAGDKVRITSIEAKAKYLVEFPKE